MSLLKLAAFGAEVLDILERDEDWNSDTIDLISNRASLLGMVCDGEDMFKVDPAFRRASRHLYEDLTESVDNRQPLSLAIAAGEKSVSLMPQTFVGEESGVSVLVAKREYEL